PKHTRTCIYLEWNPVDSQYLAEGLEKYRNDGCINIWNIHQKTDVGTYHERLRYSSSHSDIGSIVYNPFIELGKGPSETTASFSWFPKDPKTFITGMNARYLRIFDLRDLTRPHSVAQSKAIKGICVDPRNEFRIASYYEIWSSSFNLTYASGKSLRDQILQPEGLDTDISIRMKQRAEEGYGLEVCVQSFSRMTYGVTPRQYEKKYIYTVCGGG
ncbi:hypothetical protein FSP39_010218, partial [Pinctada imbricata]